ncbi:MAG: gamma-glutamyltransferase [Trueperaceae bacterium]|nr:gamma-glutamyltransferase [Trueperaceae bacterium]
MYTLKRFLTTTRTYLAALLLVGLSLGFAQNVQTGTGGAVSTVDQLATEVGIQVLQDGGNAVDAAVTAAAVISVTQPFSAGIGGGGFMLVYLADENRVVTIDSREMAPGAATPDMFIDPETGESIPFFPERITSGLAVGVPGTLAGWDEVLRRYGTMTLAEVLAPAITIAEEGFEVTEVFNAQVTRNQERFAAFTSTSALFLTEDGAAPDVGSTFTNPDLAATFREIAEGGVNAFYRGPIGQDLVNAVQTPPTIDNPPFEVRPQMMTMDDLDAYNAIVRQPTETDYHGYTIYGMAPPTSGGMTVSLILNILEGYDTSTMNEDEALHYFVEASRLAYADRGAYMGDADFVNVPVEGLLSQEFADARRQNITEQAGSDPAPGDPFAYQNDPSPPLMPPTEADTESVSTTHLVTADADGNAVSFTTTIESIGGSGIVVPGRGFLLNNELTDFSATPGGPNTVEPYKRPRSSMSPTLVMQDGELRIAVGTPGGSTIITTVAQILFNVIDREMALPEAISAPRLTQRNTSTTRIETRFDDDIVAQLEARGHTFSETDEIGAAVGLYFNDDGTITAAAEAQRRGAGTAQVVEPGE